MLVSTVQLYACPFQGEQKRQVQKQFSVKIFKRSLPERFEWRRERDIRAPNTIILEFEILTGCWKTLGFREYVELNYDRYDETGRFLKTQNVYFSYFGFHRLSRFCALVTM